MLGAVGLYHRSQTGANPQLADFYDPVRNITRHKMSNASSQTGLTWTSPLKIAEGVTWAACRFRVKYSLLNSEEQHSYRTDYMPYPALEDVLRNRFEVKEMRLG